MTECSFLGNVAAGTAPTTAIKGSLFTVENVLANGDLVIEFNTYIIPKVSSTDYALPLAKRAVYNYKFHPEIVQASLASHEDGLKFFLFVKAVQLTRYIEDVSRKERIPIDCQMVAIYQGNAVPAMVVAIYEIRAFLHFKFFRETLL